MPLAAFEHLQPKHAETTRNSVKMTEFLVEDFRGQDLQGGAADPRKSAGRGI